MSAFISAGRRLVAAVVLLLLAAVTPAAAQDRLCDPAERDLQKRDCRDILISHIRAEKVGLDVAFWFLEDTWIASEIIARKNAGVPVRMLVDSRANTSTPRNADRLAEFKTAGIPMREKFSSGILHWKMMLFEGQGIVQFSGANYSSDAWTIVGADYTNYTDEAIYFTSRPSIVNSFRTKYDSLWTNTTGYRDYANITAPLTRAYEISPIDAELNFVPAASHATRAVAAYAEETRQIDVTMYRITDGRYANAMIAAEARGVPVRLITEPVQYRDPIRQYHSWNVDRMYMAGVEIRDRAHVGLNHQKSVQLYDRGTTVFGSSNWSSASSESQEEHNLFTSDPWVFQWFTDQFERKWNNSTGLIETAPFVPLAPSAATAPAPAYQATEVPPTDLTLRWSGGYWAHKYDVLLGTSPGAMALVAENLPRRTSGTDPNRLTLEPLVPGTTYYWQVVSKTMANMTATSATWTFTTSGTAPAPPPPAPPLITLVREPYLQQVTPTSAVVVWATREPGDAEVRLMDPSGTTRTVEAKWTLYPATWTGLPADYYQYEARLTGLSAVTTYTYDIIVSGEDLNLVVDSITTAPATTDATVTFVAFGDSGTGSAGQQQIASLLAHDTFDFAMHAGDIAYANTSGTGPASFQTMDDWFFRPYAGWLRNRPIFPSMGNHDSRATNADGRPYLGLYALPTVAATAEYPDHAERYYSFDYGPVHVIVLDTEFAFQDPARRAAQLAWADADLAATTKPWKVALYHRSAYSAGGENGSELPVREAFGPLFDRHGVHLALSAHEHDYERTLPLRAGLPEAGGTTYLVTGGGGGPLYPSGYAAWTAYSASVHHYVRGTATACTLTLDAVGTDGVVFDSVTLRQCAPVADTDPPQVSITAPSAGASVRGIVTVTAAASDNVQVTAAELLVNGTVVQTDAQAPFSFAWDSTAVVNGDHELAVRAIDAAGNTATSAVVRVTVANAAAGAADIVLYAADATVVAGNWIAQNDATAAGGRLMRNPNAGAAKRTTALAAPADYFELTFTARENVPYRLWMRGKADGDVYYNDSAFIQFSGATNYAIGTTSAAEFNLEDCSGCRISGWGWQDNGWGVGVLGPTITFTSPGPHTIRVQPREDGLSIDQIMLSPSAFLETPPGALKNDSTIYPRSTGESATGEPPVDDNVNPSVRITSPTDGSSMAAPASMTIAASASDSDGSIVSVEFYAGTTRLGSATSSPYEITWSGVAAGTYTLTARASDNAGAVTTSAPVTVTVSAPEAPPSAWASQDIGAVGLAGRFTENGGTFSVTGAGADIWNSADAFHYVWQPLSGDADVVARVASIEYVHAWVKAGVMIRERLTPDSPQALMLVSPGKGIAFQRRVAAGGLSTSTRDETGTAPAWVKLERRGNTISAFRSPDGVAWTLMGSDTFTMARDVHVGLAVSSHTTSQLATAVFDSVSVTAVPAGAPPSEEDPTPEPEPDPQPEPEPVLPAGWTSQDIGPVGATGTATAQAGAFRIAGAGADIWNAADAFQYVWQPVTGDADIIARVSAVEYVHAWVKAGVMIRERLDAGSAHALMLVSPGKGLAFQRRVAAGGLSASTSGGSGTAPAWVKLERRGTTISAYRSGDGVNWTFVGADTFAMAAQVHVGLAVSSHVTGRLATATFEQVTVVPR